MIFVEELRVGNIVNTPICPGKIVGIYKDNYFSSYTIAINNLNCQIISNINDINPILISEEILLKSGFKKVQQTHTDENNGALVYLYLYFHNIDDIYCIFYGHGEFKFGQYNNSYDIGENVFILTRIRYIHQMQNLYKDLTNKDIDIII